MSKWNFIHDHLSMEHKNFHTKQRVHNARCTHAYLTQLYIMSIQPANKAVKRQTDRQTETERDRERQRHTQRQREDKILYLRG